MSSNLPASVLARFHELAAGFEFIDGLPRRLAEKKARAEIASSAAIATVRKPDNSPSLTVLKIEVGTLHMKRWLRLSVVQTRFNQRKQITESRQFRITVARSTIDCGSPVIAGGVRWRGEWKAGGQIGFTPLPEASGYLSNQKASISSPASSISHHSPPSRVSVNQRESKGSASLEAAARIPSGTRGSSSTNC